MSRNRVLYNTEAIYFSEDIASTGVTKHAQLKRVQSFGSSTEIVRQDILQVGELARIGSLVVSPPNVTADLKYLLSDGANEKILGFYSQNVGSTGEANFASGHLVSSSGQNIYEIIGAEGNDLNYETTLSGKVVRGYGNAFLSNYSVEAAVGGFPTVTVSFEASNANADVYTMAGAVTGVNTPAVDPTAGTPYAQNTGVNLPTPTSGDGAIALRPGDVVLNWGNLLSTASDKASPFSSMSGTNGLRVQNCSLSIPLSREPIEQLGSRFPFARPVKFPVTVTLSVSALANETISRNLASMLDDSSENDITLTINQPNGVAGVKYILRGAKFDSEKSSLDLSSNKTVDLSFSAQLGGPSTLTRGVFFSGSHSGAVFS